MIILMKEADSAGSQPRSCSLALQLVESPCWLQLKLEAKRVVAMKQSYPFSNIWRELYSEAQCVSLNLPGATQRQESVAPMAAIRSRIRQ